MVTRSEIGLCKLLLLCPINRKKVSISNVVRWSPSDVSMLPEPSVLKLISDDAHTETATNVSVADLIKPIHTFKHLHLSHLDRMDAALAHSPGFKDRTHCDRLRFPMWVIYGKSSCVYHSLMERVCSVCVWSCIMVHECLPPLSQRHKTFMYILSIITLLPLAPLFLIIRQNF